MQPPEGGKGHGKILTDLFPLNEETNQRVENGTAKEGVGQAPGVVVVVCGLYFDFHH